MSNQFTDCKPIGNYTKEELQALEHKYRLLLKKDGFQDIEMWDNKPLKKIKKLRFIKGHIRMSLFNNSSTEFLRRSNSTFNYYNIIGLYANHCKDMPEKYRAVLVEYATVGSLPEAVKNVNDGTNYKSVWYYVNRNFPKMIQFVNKEFQDDE